MRLQALSPCVMNSSLIQHSQRNPNASEELVSKLQVAGVPQVNPEQTTITVMSKGGSLVGRHNRHHRDWATLSPHSQLINVLFLDIKLPLCVAEGSRHLQMKRRQTAPDINSQKTNKQKAEILLLLSGTETILNCT